MKKLFKKMYPWDFSLKTWLAFNVMMLGFGVYSWLDGDPESALALAWIMGGVWVFWGFGNLTIND